MREKPVRTRLRKRTKRDALYILVCSLILALCIRQAEPPVNRFIINTRNSFANTLEAAAKKTRVNAEIVSPVAKDKNGKPLPTPTPIEIHFNDSRIKKLYSQLVKAGSPLADHAAFIIAVSDENGLDWTQMYAIAKKESSLGKEIKPGSYNPFGLGGTNYMYFASWEDAIVYEAQMLNNHYRENANAGIQQKYCPSYECSPTWVSDVTSFSQELLANEDK